ncbi:MAG: eukaryotic-like serine/threonine-protein kinase, partial [Blastocatellia bacterium]|nr:eukaryotic-like serine/threonine-protein kinase [Blastocatellia bacterium]
MTLKDQSETVTPDPTSDHAASVPANLSAPTITFDQGEGSASLNETSLPPVPALIGVTLDSRYFIQKELGQGGVGAVYLALDRKLHDKPVVIKVLLEKSLQNSWVVQKFQQEKEALARVDHPGVVGILDTGELPDGKPYLVMQFIDGVTLRSLIRPEGIPLERAADLIKQIGRALSAAHDKGIFHRDLKPENIMLQSYGGGEEQVKIIDFG